MTPKPKAPLIEKKSVFRFGDKGGPRRVQRELKKEKKGKAKTVTGERWKNAYNRTMSEGSGED